MEPDQTNITKISSQICKLLMEIVEQDSPNISHPVLISEFGNEAAKFLLKENYLSPGRNLETYWLSAEDKDVEVEWNAKLKSFVYLSPVGKFVKVKEDDLKTYDVDLGKIVSFLSKELVVLESSIVKQNQYLEGLLYFVGSGYFQKKKVAIFFARRLNDNSTLKKIEEFFIKESPTNLPKLILASSNNSCPELLKFSKAKIIPITKLLGLATDNKSLFNVDYVANILFGGKGDDLRPYVYCSENGGILFVGDKSWPVKGDKQRQIIKVICDSWQKNPDSKMRWRELLDQADIETESRFRDFFKNSKVKEVFDYDDGFVWFKSC